MTSLSSLPYGPLCDRSLPVLTQAVCSVADGRLSVETEVDPAHDSSQKPAHFVLGSDQDVPVPVDCTDGFGEAFYARPEAFLRPEVRAATSGFLLTDPGAVQRGLERLEEDLASGAWDQAYGRLREQAEHHGALRFITAST